MIMTDQEYESKKRELELKIKLLEIEQRQNYKNNEFAIFAVVACMIIVAVTISWFILIPFIF